MSISGQPEFATNRIDPADEVGPETVANAVKEMINYQLGELKNPPCVDISTAYFNPGGYNLVADQGRPCRVVGVERIRQAPRVRAPPPDWGPLTPSHQLPGESYKESPRTTPRRRWSDTSRPS